MSKRIKCKGCQRILKPEELEYKIGDTVFIKPDNHPLVNQGTIEPFCKKCIIDLGGFED